MVAVVGGSKIFFLKDFIITGGYLLVGLFVEWWKRWWLPEEEEEAPAKDYWEEAV